jgi:hypothetical protein
MLRSFPLVLVLAAACSPNADSGTGPGRDVPARDDAGGGGDTVRTCEDAACNDRCADAGYPSGACVATGACVCQPDTGTDAGTPVSVGERCGDGIDNNGNGAVDEGCACDVGATQPCYPGPVASRGIGLCRDGTQPCVPAGEFSHWGACVDFVLPAGELCDDGVDNDCDLGADEDCGECIPTEWSAETFCDDGVDNDCDTAVDCFDFDCPECCGAVELCDDGIDNNCDGIIDDGCDSPCTGFEMGPLVCDDGIDNDCDGRTDCRDLQCLPFCCTPEVCDNLEDDDCDGLVDCEDTDCCTVAACSTNPVCGLICCVPGTTRWCDTPTYCSWGQQACRPDGRWGTCEETTLRPAGCDDGSYYYSASCCVTAGECCQNFGYDRDLPSDASVGDCGGISSSCP